MTRANKQLKVARVTCGIHSCKARAVRRLIELGQVSGKVLIVTKLAHHQWVIASIEANPSIAFNYHG